MVPTFAAAVTAGAILGGGLFAALTPVEAVASTPQVASAAPDAAAAPTTSTTSPPDAISSTPSAAVVTTTTRFEPRKFTVAFTGDLLIHQGVRNIARDHAARDTGRAFDFRPLLEGISPWIETADIAVCHLEVTLSADGSRLSSYPAFRSPGELASNLVEVGYDRCSTASNHTIDFGPAGVTETLGVLEDAGLAWTGSARSAEEERASRVVERSGVRIAHLAYTYWFNGLDIPSDAPWISRQIDTARILEDAAAVRRGGAEFVMVSLHWGDEYRHEPNAQQREIGPALLSSPDIDLIVGHHAHVVQPIDRIGDEWLVHGVGNLLSDQGGRSRDELLVLAEVTERQTGGFEVAKLSAVPLFVDPATLAPIPSGRSVRPSSVEANLADELDASFARVVDVLASGSGWETLTVVD